MLWKIKEEKALEVEKEDLTHKVRWGDKPGLGHTNGRHRWTSRTGRE